MKPDTKPPFLIVLLFLLAINVTHAQLFEVHISSGQTLYCDIVPGGAKIIGWDSHSTTQEPVQITIPHIVNNGQANLYVVAIGDSAFIYGRQIVSLTIPTTVTTIGREAFQGCMAIGSITIPSNVTTIGQDAFKGIPDVQYSGTAHGAPWGALHHNAIHIAPYYYADSTKTHLVAVERAADNAPIPPTVTTLGDYAYYGCYKIKQIEVTPQIQEMGNFVFANSSLQTAYYDATSSNYNIGLFSDCQQLHTLTFGDNVIDLGLSFCHNCTSLRHLQIPDNIANVESDAFMNCTALEDATLGKGIAEIDYSMFTNCTHLNRIIATDSLRVIGIDAFSGCTSLSQVQIGDNVETIGSRAFDSCAALESIYLGRKLTSIGDKAFSRCTSLKEIVLPMTLCNIGSHAYEGCKTVTQIACLKERPPTMGSGVFDGIDSGVQVYVPCDSIDNYRQHSEFCRFDSIQGKSYYVSVTSNNLLWGHAIVTEQPSCTDNTATIQAIPHEGYRFVRWNNGKTDNPCLIQYNGGGYAYRTAIFEALATIEQPHSPSEIKVYTTKNSLTIEGAQGETICIYDVMGRQCLKVTSTTPKLQLPKTELPPSSILLIKVGSRRAIKVLSR